MSWTIVGEENAAPKQGDVFEVRHQRKGVFVVRVKAVAGEWLTGVIVEGQAGAMMAYNERDTGEEVTVRDTLCRLFRVA